MNNPEKYADLQHKRFIYQLYAIFILGGFTLLIIASWMLYPIRNSKLDEVAIRFIKNNKKLITEVGENPKIVGYGFELPNRSQEIAQKLKNGENLSEANTSKKTDISKVVLTRHSDGFWKSGKLIGSNHTIEVTLYLQMNGYGDFGDNFYYTVTKAKYREKDGEWKEMPIGWLENYFLLFK